MIASEGASSEITESFERAGFEGNGKGNQLGLNAEDIFDTNRSFDRCAISLIGDLSLVLGEGH